MKFMYFSIKYRYTDIFRSSLLIHTIKQGDSDCDVKFDAILNLNYQ